MKVSALDFQIFLVRLGHEYFFQGFYYFKFLEYPLVYNNLNLDPRDKYLDIGSGQSIFPLFALVKNDCYVQVYDDYSLIKDSMEYYKNIIEKMSLSPSSKEKFTINETTETDLPSDYFDKISCISVLEHSRGNGDTETIKTISRILKKRGKVVMTLPFNNGEYIEEENPEDIGFFQRLYSLDAIKHRIGDPSGLEVEKVIYFGECNAHIGRLYRQNKFHRLKWIMPFFPSFFWRICHSYEGGFRCFHEKELDKKYIGVSCIVMRKK
ncbi:MAG: methyltransferase domain-containing protein [Candidatus Omnitrophica bacterium]|nr:methyltransferase domain-containing protein [Candidatus Omnitrophota bacterium]MBU1853427.1 methyltransferase domain-containing protein [Candidatus Omnitrophota bacterium]